VGIHRKSVAFPILRSCALTLGHAGPSHRAPHTRCYVMNREKTQRSLAERRLLVEHVNILIL
jgi:hypothetical protein